MTIYDRQGGTLRQVIDADRARPADGAWLLENARVYDTTLNTVVRKAADLLHCAGSSRTA